jgi:hypothetical protein
MDSLAPVVSPKPIGAFAFRPTIWQVGRVTMLIGGK